MRARYVMSSIFTANKGLPWADIDDDDLRMEIARGASIEEVAVFLCRSEDEVAIRAAVLGLRWYAALH
jgi:hypothetical protein